MTVTSAAGFTVKTKEMEMAASEGSLDRFVDAWLATLAWADRNPFLCIALFCLVAFWMWLNYLRSRDSKRMSYDYKEQRGAARVQARQPALPLMPQEEVRDV